LVREDEREKEGKEGWEGRTDVLGAELKLKKGERDVVDSRRACESRRNRKRKQSDVETTGEKREKTDMKTTNWRKNEQCLDIALPSLQQIVILRSVLLQSIQPRPPQPFNQLFRNPLQRILGRPRAVHRNLEHNALAQSVTPSEGK
jgi:hypothetical protein